MATQGQVILRGGTTQSRASEALSQPVEGRQAKGHLRPAGSFLDQKPKMVATNISRFRVLLFLLKASSGKIYIGRQEGIELSNLNEASLIFYLILKYNTMETPFCKFCF